MRLHDLKPSIGSRRQRNRVGRGIAAGQGKTAGRGTKGAGSRSGSGGQLYRQGGDLPFIRRLPFKRGFTNRRKLVYVVVNIDEIDESFGSGAQVDPNSLAAAGLMKDAGDGPVVVLGRGNLSKKVTVCAHRFSRTARGKIEAAGGSVEVITYPPTLLDEMGPTKSAAGDV